MKTFLSMIIFSSIVFAQGVLSGKPIDSFETIETKGERESLKLLKEGHSSFASVRGDILYLANKGLNGFDFKDYYILGKSQQKSQLFVITRKSENLVSVQDLKGKRISLESFQNLNSMYLKKIISKTDKSVRYGIHFQFYNLEESLKRITENELDMFFAFADASLVQKKVNEKGLEIKILPSKFIKVLEENKGLINIANSIEVEAYVIVKNDIDKENSHLINMVLTLDKKNMLVRKVDESLGSIYPEIDLILEEHSNSLKLKNKLKDIAIDIKKSKSSILKRMSKVKRELGKVKGKANTFTLVSVQMDYKNQATDILEELDGEKDKLKRMTSKVDSLLEDKDKEGLKTLLTSLESMADSISAYEKNAKKIIRRMNKELVEEQEKEAEKALLEASKTNSSSGEAL